MECSSPLITPPWLNTATVSSWSPAATMSRTPVVDAGQERVLVDGAGQMTARQPRQFLGVLGGDLLDRDVVRQVAVVLGEPVVDARWRRPSASATGCAVCTARRCGLLTSRVIGNRASASGSRLACSMPSADRSGSDPSPGSLRSGKRVPDQ